LAIFGKKMAFFSKTNVMINFLHNLALFWVESANFFAEFFGENILKSITWSPWLPASNRDINICMYVMYSNLGLYGILKPYKITTEFLNLTKFGFSRKFRLKRFRKINSRWPGWPDREIQIQNFFGGGTGGYFRAFQILSNNY
jgi:hypothetical protein